jgi:hypothetical protein
LSTTLPLSLVLHSSETVGDNIYIFGGSGNTSVYKFDCINKTISTINNVSYSNTQFSAISYGQLVFLCGGSVGGIISKFNTADNTISEVTTIDKTYLSFKSILIDKDIYLFGGIDENSYSELVYKFDCVDEILIPLKTVEIPVEIRYVGLLAINDKILIVGGEEIGSVTSKKVYLLDITKMELSLLGNIDVPLKITTQFIYNNTLYIMYPYADDWSVFKQIYKLNAITQLLSGEILIVSGNNNVSTVLFSSTNLSIKLQPKIVLKGNVSNVAEYLPSAYHNGSEWVEI